MSHVGLTLKRLTLKRGRERRSEVYFTVFAGSEAAVRDGRPVLHTSQVIEGIKRGEPLEFDGLGLMLLAPVEVGSLCAWHVQAWESDQRHRDLGERIHQVGASVNHNSGLVSALVGVAAAPAAAALSQIANVLGRLLESKGDDCLLTWAGSIYSGQLDSYAGSKIIRGNDRIEIEFGLIVTEGGEAVVAD